MNIIPDRLKNLRKLKHLSQKNLAEAAKLSRTTICKHEKEPKNCGLDVATKLANALDSTVQYLTGESNIVFKADYDKMMADKKPDDISELSEKYKMRVVPHYGNVSAGLGSLAENELKGHLSVPCSWLGKNKDYFMLTVEGSSMEPRFYDGDTVLVQKTDVVENGEIAVVLIDGNNGVIKKINKTSTSFEIISLNPDFETKVFEYEDMNRVKIAGKVVMVWSNV